MFSVLAKQFCGYLIEQIGCRVKEAPGPEVTSGLTSPLMAYG